MKACPICNGEHLYMFMQRHGVPVHQNLLVQTVDSARSVTRGDLDLKVCEDCGFVLNAAFDLEKLEYGDSYDNTQTFSGYFDVYLDDLVKELVENGNLRNCTIVEVGCGKGEFLRRLVSYPGANNRGYGFDPSYVGPDTDLDGRLTFRKTYYDESCTDVVADYVVCRHVIEHVPEPLMLLQSVRKALEASPKARVFFETPCVEWILENNVVWDFFYEHCSLFSVASLRLAFERSGFDVQEVRHMFGGQYLAIEATVSREVRAVPDIRTGTADMARQYEQNLKHLRQHWMQKLQQLNQSGATALWGAGGKGATFANLIDPERKLIDCVIDLNPNKQGKFIPGTGHPIISPMDIPKRNVATAIMMNPNYLDESRKLLQDAAIQVNLI